MRATVRAVGVALAVLLVVIGVDRFVEPADISLILLGNVAGLAAVAFAVRTLWPLRRAPTDRQLARFVEERCPEMEDRLATATAVAPGTASPFRELVLGDAAARTRDVDLNRVVSDQHVRRSIVRGAVAVASLLIAAVLGFGSIDRIARSTWLHAFPATASLEVEPGDARVVTGEPLEIRARLGGTFGAPARSLPAVTVLRADGSTEVLVMRARDDGYGVEVSSVTDSFTYRVSAATLRSEEYGVTALVPPSVERVDVTYRYPAFTGLAPRVDVDGGDIYAPEGTAVTVTVVPDEPVSNGELRMASGDVLELRPAGARRWSASFEVQADDTYRVALIDGDGLASPGDVDYFVRTVFDRPPLVEILRPEGDREITRLEEAVIEARVEDDFGIERFDLVYTVVGRRMRSIDLRSGPRARRAVGTHTIYAEDLDVVPGDFISYYVRARDTNTSRDARESRSDIFFLEVRPFDREFEDAPSQSGSAADAGEIGDLVRVQKQIIVATWRLDRERPGDARGDDLPAVAGAQDELRSAAARIADRMKGRGRETGVATPTGEAAPDTDAMALAVEAMGEAAAALRAGETGLAIPLEMEALNQLLRVQAEIRRTRVSSQQASQGASSAGTQAREDLSALFDRELRREQETNYENRTPASASDAAEESEALRRVRELAERQTRLNRQHQELADTQGSLDAPELQRRLERLTREQHELREQMADLERQLTGERQAAQTGQTGRSGPSGQVGEGGAGITDRMRRALSALGRRDPAAAAEAGEETVGRLRDLERRLSRASERGARAALGSLQLEAQQLADAQRNMASQTRRMEVGLSGRDARTRLAEDRDQLACRADSLEDGIGELVRSATSDAREALAGAAGDLAREAPGARMRGLADRLRDRPIPDEGASGGPDLEAIAAADDALADVLHRVAATLRTAADPDAAEAGLLGELDEARALRHQLDQIERQLEQLADAGANASAEAGAARAARAASDGEADGPRGADPHPDVDGRAPSTGSPGGGASLGALQEQLTRQLTELPELLERARHARPTIDRDLARWAEHWFSGAAPGTDAARQDLAEWASLRDDLRLAIEAFEVAASLERAAEDQKGRHHVGADERVPAGYRRLVDQYYRSLTERPPSERR